MLYIIFFLVIFFLAISPFIRTIFSNPHLTVFYGFRDLIEWLHYKQWRILNSGFIICFVGLFGKGKTLASVHYVLDLYKKYNNKKIYDFNQKKWITQKVNILSNVDLNVPHVKFHSLQQIVDITKSQADYDKENNIRTITLVLGDEFSVQLNSREFKKNIDPLFLNALLTCRHHHITIVYNAQRFNHVDALLRQVTSYVIECNKKWRVMIHNKYDAWELENANSPKYIKPLSRSGWFITDKDFEAYDTLACVDNLTKSVEEHKMLSEEQILQLQASTPADLDSVDHLSRSYFRRLKKLNKLK